MKAKTKSITGILVLVIPTVIYATVTRVDDIEVRSASEMPNALYHSSSAVGYNNRAGWWSTASGMHNWTHNCSMAGGYNNDTKNMSVAFGLWNDVNYGARDEHPRGSFAAGTLNTVLGNSSFASGASNDITADKAAAIGEGLVITSDNAIIVGKYNEDRADLRFAVGNGSDSSTRSNAFEVYENGDVIITKPQGDISMGVFGE